MEGLLLETSLPDGPQVHSIPAHSALIHGIRAAAKHCGRNGK